jgi:integrase
VTIEVYKQNFRGYISPRWGRTFLSEVKAVEVEKWLRSLSFAAATKAKFRNQLSCIFSHAIRWELYKGENPIRSVRQSSKRQTIPDILNLEEMRQLLARLDEPKHRIAVLIAAVTGLRRSEIRGLKWKDVDAEKRWLRLERGIVRTVETKLKTEGSRRGVPLPDDLIEALKEWRSQSPFPTDDDWLLPGATGRVPLWLNMVLYDYVKPAAVQAGITKRIGWHTFRRSLAGLLAAKGENVKVVQELLRHSNPQITMELYEQADADQKRAAQEHVAPLFLVPKTKAS